MSTTEAQAHEVRPVEYVPDTQCAMRYSVSRGTWWRWVREGNAPRPVKLGPSCTRWRVSDLLEWEKGDAQ